MSALLKQRSGLAPDEEIVVAPQQNEALKRELVLRAASVRDIMGLASDRGIALREVLKGGVLAGQPVYFQSRHGPILNKGACPQLRSEQLAKSASCLLLRDLGPESSLPYGMKLP